MLVLAGLVIGLLLGGLIGLLVLRRTGDGRTARDLREELDDYRDQVANHYAETAKRVDDLTQAYKSVYDHLEQGAVRLVGEEELRRRLEDTASGPVTIEGIGRKALDAGDEAAIGPAEPDRAPGDAGDGASADGGIDSAASDAGASYDAASDAADIDDEAADDEIAHDGAAVGEEATLDDDSTLDDDERNRSAKAAQQAAQEAEEEAANDGAPDASTPTSERREDA